MERIIQVLMLLLLLMCNQGSATTVRYKHTDMLGSVIAESDSAGNITSRSHYEPFGKRLGGDKAGIGYTGHLQDEDLNLTYMQARYYDPVIGRFYSNDPVDFVEAMHRGQPVHGFNRYAYVNNNPYKYTDPNGEWGLIGAAWGAVSGGIGGAITGYKQGGWSGAAKGGAIGAAAGAAVGLVAPTAAGAFATNAAASIVGQMGGNVANGGNATDNISVASAVGAGVGGAIANSAKAVGAVAPNIYKEVIGKAVTANTSPSKAIGAGVVAVSEGVGTAIGETAGQEWSKLKDQMVDEIKEGIKD